MLSGGKLLYSFKQENPADHVENEDVLKALGLSENVASDGATGGQEGATGGETTGKVVCEEDVCKKE